MNAAAITARRYANLTQAAEYTNLSEKTLRRMIAAGRITGYRLGARVIRVDLNEIDRQLFERIGGDAA